MDYWQTIKNYLKDTKDNEIVTRMDLIGPVQQIASEGVLDGRYDLHEISVIIFDMKSQYWAASAGNPCDDNIYGTLSGPFEYYRQARRMLVSLDGRLGSSLPEIV